MLEPEKLLRELSEMPRGSGDAARANATGTAERFCGGCWAALPPGAVTCPDCGRSLAEIEASRQAKLASDHNWIPPRRQESNAASAASAPAFATPDSHVEPTPAVIGPAMPDPLAQELRRSRHHFLMAVLIGSAWGGAVMMGAWFTIKNMSSANSSHSAGIANQPGLNAPDSQPEVTIEPKLGSPVQWNNPYREIRMEIYSETGLPVAGEGEQVRLPKGIFNVQIGPRDADWRMPLGTITAKPGETVRVTITPKQAARYSLVLAKKLEKTGKISSAIAAWRTATELDPTLFEAHLMLASQLALREQYREARVHAKAAVGLQPKNEDAVEALRLINELDKVR